MFKFKEPEIAKGGIEGELAQDMRSLGLNLYESLVYIEFVKASEGYLGYVTRDSSVPRVKRYKSATNLAKIGALRVISKSPFLCHAAPPLELYLGKIENMCRNLGTALEGMGYLNEKRFEKDKSITDALLVLGLNLDEANIYKTLVQHGDCTLQEIVYYSNVSARHALRLLMRMTKLTEAQGEKRLIEKSGRKFGKYNGNYHVVLPSPLLFGEIEKMWQEVNISVRSISTLQSMYGSSHDKNKDTGQDWGARIRQYHTILLEKGGVTEENIERLSIKDFRGKGFPIKHPSFERLKSELLKRHRKGTFV
jgi:hypothetical protein